MRAFKGRFLLHGDFPINGLQNAIIKCLYGKECSYSYLESGSKHLGTRAVKYDLNFSSLPWILSIGVKKGECCHRISDFDIELQLMNVKFTLSAIMWGDGKTHFVGMSVDVSKK